MLKRIIPIAIIALWIVPVGWVGLVQSSYPLYPTWLAPIFRVSGVFESAPPYWRIFFIEAQDETGWHYVDERALFASTPLGNRTRFQPLMNDIEKNEPGEVHDLLEWVARHLNKNSHVTLRAARIVYFEIPSEEFLLHASMVDVYGAADRKGLSRHVVSTLDIHT